MGCLCYQIRCVFAEYDLFKPIISIQNSIYIYIDEFSYKFDIVFYPFAETGTPDITFMGRNQELTKVINFQPIPTFVFPLQSLQINMFKIKAHSLQIVIFYHLCNLMG